MLYQVGARRMTDHKIPFARFTPYEGTVDISNYETILHNPYRRIRLQTTVTGIKQPVSCMMFFAGKVSCTAILASLNKGNTGINPPTTVMKTILSMVWGTSSTRRQKLQTWFAMRQLMVFAKFYGVWWLKKRRASRLVHEKAETYGTKAPIHT